METKTHKQLVEAVLRGIAKHGVPNSFGLMQLETNFKGPSCGAAGGVVRRWPEGGVVVTRDGKNYRLKYGRIGKKSVVRIDEIHEAGSNADG